MTLKPLVVRTVDYASEPLWWDAGMRGNMAQGLADVGRAVQVGEEKARRPRLLACLHAVACVVMAKAGGHVHGTWHWVALGGEPRVGGALGGLARPGGCNRPAAACVQPSHVSCARER